MLAMQKGSFSGPYQSNVARYSCYWAYQKSKKTSTSMLRLLLGLIEFAISKFCIDLIIRE
jgi:hypothetical protein